LPGAPELTSELYAGYITVDVRVLTLPSTTSCPPHALLPQPDRGRALFYTFHFTSFDLPLVLWLNGGPGCSSLGGGWLSELGPFTPKADGTLQVNPGAWTGAANVIFLESPAGVGFSYFNTSGDQVVGDARTAADARLFLLGFMDRYPELVGAPLYISGESYAGHYIPTLAKAILEGQETGPLNLSGVFIGNAWTDAGYDNLGAATHWVTHNHISTSTFSAMTANCDWTQEGPIKAVARAHAAKRGVLLPSRQSDACDAACAAASKELGDLNIYQLYADVCHGDYRLGGGLQLAYALAQIPFPESAGKTAAAPGRLTRARAAAASLLRSLDPATSSDASGFPRETACIDSYVEKFLNRADVQAALHVAPGFTPYWTDCTNKIRYDSSAKDGLLTSMLPVYDTLLAAGLRIWIYSGDVDGIVPTAGSRLWIESLQLKETEHWRPWYAPSARQGQQVGGYFTRYAGLTFATVRGAGHMVPTTQPVRALALFKAFLADAEP